MAVVITPGQLSRRAEFYHQLGQLTAAGLGLVRALEQLERNPPAHSYRQPIHAVLAELAEGSTFSESVQRIGRWLPAFDIALLQAGEQSGRLDGSFRTLADYYAERASLARQIIIDLAYPAFLFHFAILIFAFVGLITSGSWMGFLYHTLGILLPVYAIIGFTIYAGQSGHGESWRALIESVLHPIPVLGTARRCLALSRLAGVLEALLSAGITVIEAWEMAAAASGSPRLRRVVLAWRPLVDGGQTPGETLSATGRFPELFANQYVTGEISGKLDETLGRLSQYYREEGSRKLRIFTRTMTFGVYLCGVLIIAYFIINFWMGHFRQIQDAGGF